MSSCSHNFLNIVLGAHFTIVRQEKEKGDKTIEKEQVKL